MKKPKKYGKIGIIAIIAIIILGLLIGVVAKNNAIENYGSRLSSARANMLAGAVRAEDATNLIRSVWYNAIYDKYDSETYEYTKGTSDFNDALANLFADSSFSTQIRLIEDNQSSVANQMKKLTNPPEEYEDAYDTLKDLYEAYVEYTNMATDPTGNYNSYTSGLNSSSSEFLKHYKALEVYE